MSGISAVALFLVSLVFSLLIFSLWLRIALRYLRVSTLHPISQLINKVSDPIVNPIQQITQQKFKPGQKYDIPTLISLVLVELLKMVCISLLALHGILPVLYLLIFVLADLIIQPCDILFFAILARVIMSFVNPGWRGPIAELLRLLTEPLLKPARKFVSDVAGFDLSPFIIMILLKMITLFISASLPWRLL